MYNFWTSSEDPPLFCRDTASSAEILSAALQEHGVATILGEQTFGKGTVQEVDSYSDGSIFKFSVAQWLTPSGLNINGVGLTPDIVVKTTIDDLAGRTDSQLKRAIEEIVKQA